MNNATEILDFYVKGIKSTGAFPYVKFVYAGKTRAAEFPVENYIVACSVGRASKENLSRRNSELRYTLHFDAYAPANASKRELASLCIELASEIEKLDCGMNRHALEVAEGVYESNLCTWRQQVRVKLYSVTEMQSEVLLLADGEPLTGVKKFEEKTQRNLHPVKEFLSGITDYFDAGDDERVLLVCVNGESRPFKNGGFDLLCGESNNLYKGCRVQKMHRKRDADGNLSDEYTLIYKEKIEGEIA